MTLPSCLTHYTPEMKPLSPNTLGSLSLWALHMLLASPGRGCALRVGTSSLFTTVTFWGYFRACLEEVGKKDEKEEGVDKKLDKEDRKKKKGKEERG